MSTEMTQYVEDLEAQKVGNQKMIDVGVRLERLCKDSDFRSLILEFWMKDETARYAQLSQDPTLSVDIQKDCMQMAAASGHFKRWVDAIRQQAQVAKDAYREANEELDRLRAEPEAE